jgi:hypothetical protein
VQTKLEVLADADVCAQLIHTFCYAQVTSETLEATAWEQNVQEMSKTEKTPEMPISIHAQKEMGRLCNDKVLRTTRLEPSYSALGTSIALQKVIATC